MFYDMTFTSMMLQKLRGEYSIKYASIVYLCIANKDPEIQYTMYIVLCLILSWHINPAFAVGSNSNPVVFL